MGNIKKLLIILNGKLSDNLESYKNAFKKEKFFVIACDGGFLNAQKLGIKPDLLIGDFDSVGDLEVENKIQFPVEKDKSDAELAVDWGINNGFSEFEIWGALGGDVDHTLFNISLLLKIEKAGKRGRIFHPPLTIFLLEKAGKIIGNVGDKVSLYPFTDVVKNVKVRGFKYPLHEEDIVKGSTRTLSNELIKREGWVEFKEGIILVIRKQVEAHQSS